MTGTKEHPKDIFGGVLELGDTVAYIRHGRMGQGLVDGFTAFGVKLISFEGTKIGTVLRDRVVGPRSLSTS